jgi:hypothetical protein
VVVRKYIFAALGIELDNEILFVFVKIFAIYIVYQVMLLLVGSALGEYRFVRWFLLKMNGRMIPGRK